ncbi:MAG: CBS domain-containing protein [Phycisphaerales bacterium]|nr:CBS domain-containing protein [Phycisphaerales bacterium]
MMLDSIMTRQVVTVSMDDTLAEVRRVMSVYHIHHVVVIELDRVVGVVSDRDLLSHISPFVGTTTERRVDTESLTRKVHQTMTRQLIVGTPAMTAEEAAYLILTQGVSCLPVVDTNGGCLGIVTWRDLLRVAYDTESVKKRLEESRRTKPKVA